MHGALGHNNEERSEYPMRVEALEHCHAVQLSMGHEFSALLTTDDRLYVWGKVSFLSLLLLLLLLLLLS